MLNYILRLVWLARDFRQFCRMSHQEIAELSTPARQPLPESWADSLKELESLGA